jgi:thiosulfate dehydrogenase
MPSCRFPAAAGFAAALLLAGAGPALAASPLARAVAHGKQMFLHDTFGGNGRTCETCHIGGGRVQGSVNGQRFPSLRNAAAIYPLYNPREGMVLTLEEQVNHCIAGALGGTPPAYGGADMAALTAYITSLAQGRKIDIGGQPK